MGASFIINVLNVLVFIVMNCLSFRSESSKTFLFTMPTLAKPFRTKREGPLRRYSRGVIQAQHPDSDEIHPAPLKEEEIEDLFGRSSS
jgi:hypothetical protein